MNSIKCHFCEKTVYKAEERIVDSKVFHPACVSKWQKSEDSKLSISPKIPSSFKPKNGSVTTETTKIQNESQEEEVIFSPRGESIRKIIEMNKKEKESTLNTRRQKEVEKVLAEQREAENASLKLKEQIERRKREIAEKKIREENEEMTLVIEFVMKIRPTLKYKIAARKRELEEKRRQKEDEEMARYSMCERSDIDCQNEMRKRIEIAKRKLYLKKVKENSYYILFSLSEMRIDRKQYGPSPPTLPKDIVYRITSDYYNICSS